MQLENNSQTKLVMSMVHLMITGAARDEHRCIGGDASVYACTIGACMFMRSQDAEAAASS